MGMNTGSGEWNNEGDVSLISATMSSFPVKMMASCLLVKNRTSRCFAISATSLVDVFKQRTHCMLRQSSGTSSAMIIVGAASSKVAITSSKNGLSCFPETLAHEQILMSRETMDLKWISFQFKQVFPSILWQKQFIEVFLQPCPPAPHHVSLVVFVYVCASAEEDGVKLWTQTVKVKCTLADKVFIRVWGENLNHIKRETRNLQIETRSV